MNWPNWEGETVVVVATGPSAGDVAIDRAKDKARVIAVKDAWRLCPWADVLYSCDHHWWEAHKGVIEYEGLRIAFDQRTIDKWRGLPFLKIEIIKRQEAFQFRQIGHVGWGGNSGYHAFNLAAQFGAAKIVLVGFDLNLDRGSHFFGDHPYRGGPTLANCKKWSAILDRQTDVLAERGIEVVNCSHVSALTAYPKRAFEEVFA